MNKTVKLSYVQNADDAKDSFIAVFNDVNRENQKRRLEKREDEGHRLWFARSFYYGHGNLLERMGRRH